MTAAHIHGPATATEAADPVIDTMTDTVAGSAPITDEQPVDLMTKCITSTSTLRSFPKAKSVARLL